MVRLDFRYIIVGVFGFFGAILRTSLFQLLENVLEIHLIILIINSIGSLLFGYGFEVGKNKDLGLFSKYNKEILSGLIGSFTTFAMLEFTLYDLFDHYTIYYSIGWILLEIVIGIILFKYGLIFAQRHTKHRNLELDTSGMQIK